MKIAVSACLLGCPCRYDHGNCYSPSIARLASDHILIPVCPETMGGLESPRVPCEIVDGKVINRDGEELTEKIKNGAALALEAAKEENCQAVICKQYSPSCGCGKIYDGSFSGTIVRGDGIFTRMLKENGIPVISNDDFESRFEQET